jgi:hypothetical protein
MAISDRLASWEEMWPQPAPPDCGLSTSATPKAFGLSALQVLRHHYKLVMNCKINCLMNHVTFALRLPATPMNVWFAPPQEPELRSSLR